MCEEALRNADAGALGLNALQIALCTMHLSRGAGPTRRHGSGGGCGGGGAPSWSSHSADPVPYSRTQTERKCCEYASASMTATSAEPGLNCNRRMSPAAHRLSCACAHIGDGCVAGEGISSGKEGAARELRTRARSTAVRSRRSAYRWWRSAIGSTGA